MDGDLKQLLHENLPYLHSVKATIAIVHKAHNRHLYFLRVTPRAALPPLFTMQIYVLYIEIVV